MPVGLVTVTVVPGTSTIDRVQVKTIQNRVNRDFVHIPTTNARFAVVGRRANAAAAAEGCG